jgi:hypothetical protein
MKMFKLFSIMLIAGTVITFGPEIGERLSVPGVKHLVPIAEARVGRPLTPVSVAGVARRTTRRCAAGVYNCKLPGLQSLERMLVQL